MADVTPSTAEVYDHCTGKPLPSGCAVISSMGWSDGEPSEFTATLRFPNGPPRIPMSVVLDGVPVRLVLVDPPDRTREVNQSTWPQPPR